MTSSNKLLIQVLGRLTPARCGISDQAVGLARELEAAFGISTAFVVLNSSEPCELLFPRVYCAQSELLDACDALTGGQQGTLLVHASGYGYSSDGAPRELAAALARVRATDRYRIAVYFHELYATGMPWKSAFWYSSRQKNALRRIAGDADLLVTSTRLYADWLEQETIRHRHLPTQLLSVFSSVGETHELIPMANRRPAMVVLGLPGSRLRAYKQLRSVGQMLHDLGIEEIMDVGPEMDPPPESSGIPVTPMGVVPSADLAGLLSRSRFGFAKDPAPYLAKSSVFSSYCAQGTVGIVAKPFYGEVDGLTDGVHVISPRTARLALKAGLDNCSVAELEWHSGHRLHVHAETYARFLDVPSTGSGATAL